MAPEPVTPAPAYCKPVKDADGRYVCAVCGFRDTANPDRPFRRQCPGGRPATMPAMHRRAWSVTAALGQFVADRLHFVGKAEYARRLAICDRCEHRDGDWCRACGCSLTVKAKGRVWQCTFHRWHPGGEDMVARGRPHTYIRTADLVAEAERLAEFLPEDLTAVIGVARSGMIPAAAIAAKLHLPLFAMPPEGPVVDCGAGFRLKDTREQLGDGQLARPLVVDDTICAGVALGRARKALARDLPGATIRTAVIYSTPHNVGLADYVAVALPVPHWLEWNLYNSSLVCGAAFDLDGVIHGHRGRPMQLPRRTPVLAIVTARLQRERPATVRWLRKWGVRYRRLIMGPWNTLADRDQPGVVAQWKADVYRELTGASLYVESEPGLAREIAHRSKKRTLCPRTGEVFTP